MGKKSKQITSSYGPNLGATRDNAFSSLENLLPQALASKVMYYTAMQIQGGNYQGQHEAIPILDTVRKTGISLILRKFNSLESLERAIDDYAANLEDSFCEVVGGGKEVKAATKASINFGDAPSAKASGGSALNYPKTKEMKHPQGSRNLMNRKLSECIRWVVQTFARNMVNDDGECRGLLYEKQDFTCTSLLMLDLCCLPFDPEDKTDKAYYTKVDGCCKKLGGLTHAQFFFINYTFYLLQLKISHLKNDGCVPFPFMTLSEKTHHYWF